MGVIHGAKIRNFRQITTDDSTHNSHTNYFCDVEILLYFCKNLILIMNMICLDIEATNKGEVLELSVIRFEDNVEIYHSYFKPVHSQNWPTNIHHITPEMVKGAPIFSNERSNIQHIINNTDAIIGFALHNDTKYLRNNGIIIPNNVYLLEVQEWFWYYKGKTLGIDLNAVPRLSKCAEILGHDFSEDKDAHSATNDTLMTISIFKDLLSNSLTKDINERLIQDFEKNLEIEKRLHAERIAKGIISLIKCKEGYYIKNNAFGIIETSELAIAVNSRYIAEHDIREKFRRKEIKPNSGIYRLNDSDIEYFIHYSNVYDYLKEESLRCIYNAKKSHKKNLNFNIF